MADIRTSSVDELSALVRRSLEEGRHIEIERLGTFRPLPGGGFEFVSNRRPGVFLAYAEEDGPVVEKIYRALELCGFDPWMDRRKLVPGQNWPRAIEGAIETADFFVACLSRRSIAKRGCFQSEMRYALDCARNSPFDDIYFIPVRLEECRVPRQIQRQYEYVDLFPDFDAGLDKIVGLIRAEVARRSTGPGR